MTAPTVECTIEDLVARAGALVDPQQRRLLGVTGAPGAGKSTVAAEVARALGPHVAAFVPMDGFHLANTVLAALGRADRKGAPDTFDDAGYAALLDRLRRASPDETVYAPQYRREVEESIGSALPVPPEVPLIITEGNYLLLGSGAWPRARAALDEVWFLAPDDEVRRERLVRRHEAFGKSPEQARRWTLGSDERNADVVAATRDLADLVVRLR